MMFLQIRAKLVSKQGRPAKGLLSSYPKSISRFITSDKSNNLL